MSGELSALAAGQPRSNGELVFDQPWQSRAFGLAAAAVDAGRFDWSDFQKYLIAEVAHVDAAGADTATTADPAVYYSCWLAALERLAADKDLAPAAELAELASQYAAREPGHDH